MKKQTTIYKGMNILQLMKHVSTTKSVCTDPESICEMQDILAHCTEEQLAYRANDDKITFLRITRHAWDVETQFKFYNKYMSPLHEAYREHIENVESDAADAIAEKEAEIIRLLTELNSIKSSLGFLRDFANS